MKSSSSPIVSRTRGSILRALPKYRHLYRISHVSSKINGMSSTRSSKVSLAGGLVETSPQPVGWVHSDTCIYTRHTLYPIHLVIPWPTKDNGSYICEGAWEKGPIGHNNHLEIWALKVALIFTRQSRLRTCVRSTAYVRVRV